MLRKRQRADKDGQWNEWITKTEPEMSDHKKIRIQGLKSYTKQVNLQGKKWGGDKKKREVKMETEKATNTLIKALMKKLE